MAMRRRKGHEEANHERWLLTYADLITLLLVFFVVLYSISKADSEKFQQVSNSLRQAFNVDVLARPAESGGGPARLESDPRFLTFLAVRGQVAAIKSRTQIAPDIAEVELTREGIVIHLPEAVLFPPASADLRPESTELLHGLAAIIGPMTNPVRIEGHTDNTPPDGELFRDNWELSILRSLNVIRFLSQIQGIPAERLSAVGYGEFRPLGDNATIEGRRKNRRVDLVIVMPTTG